MDSIGQQRTTASRRIPGSRRGLRAAAAAGAAGLLALSGCAAEQEPAPEPSEEGPVLVGAGPTLQTRTIAHAWVLALEDGGVPAEVREVDGGRSGYLEAVESGGLDVYPDFTGDLYLELDAASPDDGPSAGPSAAAGPSPGPSGEDDQDGQGGGGAEQRGLVDPLGSLLGQSPDGEGFTDADVETALAQELPEGTELLRTSAADRTRSMAVTAATGAELSGGSVESLAEQCSEMTIGVLQEEIERPVTVPALEALYDCRPEEVVGFDTPQQAVDALLRDEVQASVVVTTRPEIEDNALVVLEDNRGAMIPERVVPVAREDLPGQARGVIDDVGGRLDEEALRQLTRMTTSSTPYTPYEAADYWWGTQQ
ncbi:glycine betaine ABC transporter substrate-binding protein [Kocuria palustris]|uniref:glycine betaine ABC transporter substrate-binding protein n=1 Tax=Kocuria palustris TaxID=71999 RepID=UPI0011A4C3C3|nr:glycine betaine ABC transporter substrate-binding protein [Kocuria palustris]